MGCKLGTSSWALKPKWRPFWTTGSWKNMAWVCLPLERLRPETLLKSPSLEKGQTRSVLIAPLAAFQEEPQVVVFTADSQQVMWLLYAVNYEKGGRDCGTCPLGRCLGRMAGGHSVQVTCSSGQTNMTTC